MGLTFAEFHARWPDFPGQIRSEAFGTLSQREQDECWDALLERADARIESKLLYEERLREEWPPPKRHQPAMRSQAATSATPGVVALSSTDPLKRTPPSEYVEAFTGQAVPASNKIWCPLHDEHGEPSFHVYPDHWHCFGCHTTGGVYELASRLTGLDTRGPEFLELRRWVAAALLRGGRRV